MSKLEQIEQEIQQLPREDLFQLREWVQEQYNQAWDKQFEEDVHSGCLDSLANAAILEHKQGQSQPFPPDA